MVMHTGPYIYLRWENASNQRYYEVHLQQDLICRDDRLYPLARQFGTRF